MRKGGEILVGGRGLASTENSVIKICMISRVWPRLTDGRAVADVEAEGLGDYFVGERTRVFAVFGDDGSAPPPHPGNRAALPGVTGWPVARRGGIR